MIEFTFHRILWGRPSLWRSHLDNMTEKIFSPETWQRQLVIIFQSLAIECFYFMLWWFNSLCMHERYFRHLAVIYMCKQYNIPAVLILTKQAQVTFSSLVGIRPYMFLITHILMSQNQMLPIQTYLYWWKETLQFSKHNKSYFSCMGRIECSYVVTSKPLPVSEALLKCTQLLLEITGIGSFHILL